jgi:hypothetical protein
MAVELVEWLNHLLKIVCLPGLTVVCCDVVTNGPLRELRDQACDRRSRERGLRKRALRDGGFRKRGLRDGGFKDGVMGNVRSVRNPTVIREIDGDEPVVITLGFRTAVWSEPERPILDANSRQTGVLMKADLG